MDAVEFIKTKNRMCKIYCGCIGCPFSPPGCGTITAKEPEKAIKIVNEWLKEHPVKTNRDALIDLVEEHFGSNYVWNNNGLNNSITLNFTNGFLDEEYNGEKQEQKEKEEKEEEND